MHASALIHHFNRNALLFLSLVVVIFATGCNRSSAPPAQFAVEQLPGALEKAFQKAAPNLKELASQIIGTLPTPDYPRGYLALQNLAAQSGLSKEQGSVIASALLALNGHLQSAQSQGDLAAAQTLKYYRQSK